MERFRVTIHGDRLDRAMARLNGSGIPTIGVFPAYFVEQGPPEDFRLEGLTAFVDAEASDDAEARVKELLPDGDYRVAQRDD